MNIRLFILCLLGCSLVGCSRGKTSSALSGKGIEHPSVPRVELPPEENAYHVWTNAMRQALPPKGDEALGAAIHAACSFKTNFTVTPGRGNRAGETRASVTTSNLTTVADCSILLEWLKSQKPVLEQIDKGLALGKIQYPLVTMSNAVETLHMSGWAAIYNLKKVNGRYLAESGDYAGAINQFYDIYTMNTMMATAHGTALACMIRDGLISGGYAGGLKWLSLKHKDNAILLREILSRIPPPVAGDATLTYSCQKEASSYTLDSFKQIAEQKIYYNKYYPSRLYSLLDPEETTTLIQAFYAQAATNACKPWTARDLTISDEVDRRLASANLPKKPGEHFSLPMVYTQPAWMKDAETIAVWKSLKQCARSEPNIYGLLWLNRIMDPVSSTHKRSVKLQCEINLLRTAIALMIIKAETGNYPDTLDEVVKKGLLSELPTDFFSDKPLLYAPEHRCLWSIGSDGINNGGESKTDVIFLLP